MKTPTGWIPEAAMGKAQQATHHEILDQMPKFSIRGNWKFKERRYSLWAAARKVTGDFLPYIRQITGSCVGASAGNAMLTLLSVEIAGGNDPDAWHLFWWPYAYGEGREIAGLRGRGEGSFGSAQAKALIREGIFRADVPGLPSFRERSGWLELPKQTELEWSDGAAIAKKWNELGREHLLQTAAPIGSTDDAAAAIANGYPLTIAAMFGTRTIRTKGNPPVNVAEWDDRWAHQQMIDEVWDHPQLGLLFRISNQWGPNAHPAPASGEPAGGYYITEATLQKILRDRGSECYAYSQYDGYPAQDLDWTKLW